MHFLWRHSVWGNLGTLATHLEPPGTEQLNLLIAVDFCRVQLWKQVLHEELFASTINLLQESKTWWQKMLGVTRKTNKCIQDQWGSVAYPRWHMMLDLDILSSAQGDLKLYFPTTRFCSWLEWGYAFESLIQCNKWFKIQAVRRKKRTSHILTLPQVEEHK